MQRLIILALKLYQRALSPFLPRCCRFQPTCSDYAIQAIQRWGVCKGGYYSVKRLLSCHPWHRGGWDPVPKK